MSQGAVTGSPGVPAGGKSGASASSRVLPSGGGSVAGLGETFAPNLQMGTLDVSVPLELPQGRGALQPELTLTYSSGSGNGVFGLGWEISTESITRSTRHGMPAYSPNDVFLLNGRDVVHSGKAEGEAELYLIDGPRAFETLTYVPGSDQWELRDASGFATQFGGTPSSVVRDASRPGRTFRWLPTRQTDACGNRIEYAYTAHTPTSHAESDTPHNQVYLRSINYVNLEHVGEPPFLYSVLFDYGELNDRGEAVSEPPERPDIFSTFRPGFEVRTELLCRRILILRHDGSGAKLVSSYELEYHSQSPNHVSLLSHIVRCGYHGVEAHNREYDAPLEFAYSSWEPGQAELLRIPSAELPAGGLVRPGLELLDAEGLGLTGLIETNRSGQHTFWRNVGDARLTPTTGTVGPPLSLADQEVWLVDLNGDGYPDLAQFGAKPHFFAARPPHGWADNPTYFDTRPPQFTMSDGRTRLVDLDGDGVMDAVTQLSGEFVVHFNRLSDGWESRRAAAPADLPSYLKFSDHQRRLRFADLSGDGPLDLAEVGPGYLRFWPHWGAAQFGRSARIEFALPEGLSEDNFDPRRLHFADIDGDGFDDLLYAAPHYVAMWVNCSGRSLEGPWVFRLSEPERSLIADRDLSSMRVVDLLGTGTAGLMWTAQSPPSSKQQTDYFYLDVVAGAKPYVMTGIENHRGRTARIEYVSSSASALADDNAGRPWKSRLPFPVPVVAEFEVADVFSDTTLRTTYRYHEGAWDGLEREFRGFARVDRVEATTVTTVRDGGATGTVPASVEIRTWFHVGCLGPVEEHEPLTLTDEYTTIDPPLLTPTKKTQDLLAELPGLHRRRALRALSGQELRSETYIVVDDIDRASTRRLEETVEHVYELRQLGARAEAAIPHVYFSRHHATRTTQWAGGNDPMTRIECDLNFDDFGRPLTLASVSAPRGKDLRGDRGTGDPYIVVVTERTFARPQDDSYLHPLDRVATSVVYEAATTGTEAWPELVSAITERRLRRRPVSATCTTYDGDPFVGLTVGALGRWALPVRVEELVVTAHQLDSLPPWASRPPWVPARGVSNHSSTRSPPYPDNFADYVTKTCGLRHLDEPGTPMPSGTYATTSARAYDVQLSPTGFGVVMEEADASGVRSSYEYGEPKLWPRTIRRAQLVTKAEMDLDIQKPVRLTDENGNETHFTYTPLGRVASATEPGEPGSLGTPTIEYRFGLTSGAVGDGVASRQPTWVHLRRRLVPLPGGDLPAGRRPDSANDGPGLYHESREYFDGFGRSLQTRIRHYVRSNADEPTTGAAGPEQVRVTGRVTYDARGLPVSTYLPYFDLGWQYRVDDDPGMAREHILRDASGRPLRLVNADGSEHDFIYGQVRSLARASDYVPTPWEAFEYDAQDNSWRTHPDRARAWADHWNTPRSVVLDAQGRIARVNEHVSDTTLSTTLSYDALGRLIGVVDARGRRVYEAVWDLRGLLLFERHVDTGSVIYWRDAAGELIERRDSSQSVTLYQRDHLHRLTHRWATDTQMPSPTLRARWCYGDVTSIDASEAASRNLINRVQWELDETGLREVRSYNAHGDPVSVSRRYLALDHLVGLSAPTLLAPQNTWPPPSGELMEWENQLDLHEFDWECVYDLEGRPLTTTFPEGRAGRLQATFGYGPSGDINRLAVRVAGLKGSDAAPVVVIEDVEHDARGMRRRIERPAFDTVRGFDERTGAMVWEESRTRSGVNLQRLELQHDLLGHVIAISRLQGNDVAPSVFTLDLDARYRLTGVSGTVLGNIDGVLWKEHAVDPTPREPSQLELRYSYDDVGNPVQTTRVFHGTTCSVSFELVDAGNTLNAAIATLDGKSVSESYKSDACGRMVAEGRDRNFTWNPEGLLAHVSEATGAGGVDEHTCYDVGGRRVLTIGHKPGREPWLVFEPAPGLQQVWERGTETWHLTREVLTLAPPVGPERDPVCLVERVDGQASISHILSDHVGSGRVELQSDGSSLRVAEYTPFGSALRRSLPMLDPTAADGQREEPDRPYRDEESSTRSNEDDFLKIDGFTGVDWDPASAWVVLGQRHYAPWLCRTVNPERLDDLRRMTLTTLNRRTTDHDPAIRKTPALALSPYMYAANQPLTHEELDGRDAATVALCRARLADEYREGYVKAGIIGGIGAALWVSGPQMVATARTGLAVGAWLGGPVGAALGAVAGAGVGLASNWAQATAAFATGSVAVGTAAAAVYGGQLPAQQDLQCGTMPTPDTPSNAQGRLGAAPGSTPGPTTSAPVPSVGSAPHQTDVQPIGTRPPTLGSGGPTQASQTPPRTEPTQPSATAQPSPAPPAGGATSSGGARSEPIERPRPDERVGAGQRRGPL